MKNAFKYLSKYCSSDPNSVDRLIVSAFLYINALFPQKNKLLKTYFIDKSVQDEYQSVQDFVEILKKEKTKFDFEDLIQLFEFVISPSDRIINGAVYTPNQIRKFIISKTIGSQKGINSNFKIADISCGCGGFLYDASIEIKDRTNKSFEIG